MDVFNLTPLWSSSHCSHILPQVDVQKMQVSCDADEAYSEGCCELSSVVSHPAGLSGIVADMGPVCSGQTGTD